MTKDTDKTKEQLLDELTELRKKSKEQEDKLKASNQQLDSHNQQLTASEQTLKKQTHKLGERVKELNCLHSISEAVRTRETMEEILQDVAEIIPPGWQYPKITCSKIILWDKEYKTENYKDSKWKLSSDIRVNKKIAGKIEVCYLGKKPESDIGPFLKEERNLLDNIAERLCRIIERKNAEEALKATNQQLRAANQQLRATEQQLRAANRELIVSEEKYRMLFENMLNGFAYHQIVTDEKGKAIDYVFMEVNDAFEEMTGLKREKIIGKKVTEALPGIENDPADWIGKYGEVALSGKELRFEQYAEPLGKWYSVYAFSPKEGFFATVFEDITEHKQAEEKIKAANQQLQSNEKALKASEERLELAMMIKNEGIWDWNLLTNQVDFDQRYYTMAGYDPGDFANNLEEFQKRVHPEEVDNVMSTAEQYLAGQIEKYQFEFRFKRKDGSWMWIQARGQIVERDEKGIPLRFIGTHSDITERKQVEKDLKDSQIRYYNLFEYSSEFLFTLDLKGNFTDVNKAATELTGYSKSELLKMNFKDYSPKSHHRKLFHAFFNIYKTGKPLLNYPIEVFVKDKTRKYFESSFTLLKKGGQVIGFQGNSKDITERKKSEQIQNIIHNISNAVLSGSSLKEFLNVIKTELETIIDASNLYIVLYDKSSDTFDLIYHKDKYDKFDKFPAGKSLTAYVFKTGKPLLATKSVNKKLQKSGDVELMGTPSKVWLGVPLISKGEKFGVIAVQSYENEEAYTESDMRTLEIISDQISITLDRKKTDEKLSEYRDHLEKLVKERTMDLTEKNMELERFNKLFVDREFRIKELRDRVKELEAKIKSV